MGEILNKARLEREKIRSARLEARKLKVVRVQTEPAIVSHFCETTGESGVVCSHLFSRPGRIKSVMMSIGAVESVAAPAAPGRPAGKSPEPVVVLELELGNKVEKRSYAARAGINEYVNLGLVVERGSLLKISVPKGYPRLLNTAVAVEWAGKMLEEELEPKTPPTTEVEVPAETPEPAPAPAPDPAPEPEPAPAKAKAKTTKSTKSPKSPTK